LIVLGSSIINIAFHKAKAGLRVSGRNLPWVITAYTPILGDLILLGGRISDFFGPVTASTVVNVTR